jgi:hypothetical protein
MNGQISRQLSEEVQMADKYVKKSFNILSHKGNANENYISPQPNWQSSRKQTITNAGEDVVGERNPHTLLVGM